MDEAEGELIVYVLLRAPWLQNFVPWLQRRQNMNEGDNEPMLDLFGAW